MASSGWIEKAQIFAAYDILQSFGALYPKIKRLNIYIFYLKRYIYTLPLKSFSKCFWKKSLTLTKAAFILFKIQ